MDRVTVVTVCYNAEYVILNTLCSVYQQDYQNIEYIVVDGFSEDNTLKVVETCRNQYEHIKNVQTLVITEKDNGIYDAMNKAIALATGEWIIFMNAGDLFYNSSVISNVFNVRFANEVKGVYGDTEHFYNDWRMLVSGKPLESIEKEIPLPFCHQSVFVRLEVMKDIRYDTQYKQAGDYNFFLLCFLRKYTFSHVNVVVSRYSMGGISERNTVFHLHEKLTIRENARVEHYGIFKKIYLLTKLQLKQMVKKQLPKKLLKRIRGY